MKTSRIIAAVLLSTSFAANATTLIDGSFEIKGTASPVTDYCYDGIVTPGGPACAASAWTGGGIILSGSGPWGGTTTPTGVYFAFVQGSSVLSQTFTATETTSIALSWADAGRGNNGGPQTYAVSISDGVSSVALGSFTTAVGQPFTIRAASPFAVANGVSYTLSFTGLSTDDRTSFIDNVALAVVPEPSTWALLVVGFGLVGVAVRRRRYGTLAA